MPEITLAAVVLAFIGWLGHTAIAVAVKNRIDARAFPPWILHAHTVVHALVVIAGLPLCLLAALCFFVDTTANHPRTATAEKTGTVVSPQPFNGAQTPDSIQTGDVPWLLPGGYLVICWIGILATLGIRTRRRLRPATDDFKTTGNVLCRFPAESAEQGVHGFAARVAAALPGNESLSVEINEKTVFIPRLAGLDGLTILHFSDTHFAGNLQSAYFRWALAAAMHTPVDLVVFTGDLLDEPRCIDWLPETFGTLRARLGCHFVLGNHDDHAGCVPRIRAALQELGWHDATQQKQLLTSDGGQIELFGTEHPWMGQLPQVSANKPSTALRILISHSPDTIIWAAARGFDLLLAGHNHGGQIQLPGFGPVYSPSRFGSTFASGCFTVSGTRLHVSRGLGSRFPLRWNCPPEITRLTFRVSEPNPS